MAATRCYFLTQGAACSSDLPAIQQYHYADCSLRSIFRRRSKEAKGIVTLKISRNHVAENASSIAVRFSANEQPGCGTERSMSAIDLVKDSLHSRENAGQNGGPIQQSNLCPENYELDSSKINANIVTEGLHRAEHEAFGGSESTEATSANVVTDISNCSRTDSCIQLNQSDSLALSGDNAKDDLQVATEDDTKLIEGVFEEMREVHGAEIASVLLAYRHFKIHIASLFRDVLKQFKQETPAETQQGEDDLSHGKTTSQKDENQHNGAVLASIPRKASHLDKITWVRLKKLWNEPSSDKIRILVSMANLTMSLPTFLTRTLPSISNWQVPFNSVSFSVLAPVLFGGGMIFKSSVARLSALLPRIGMSLVVLWVIWGLHGLIREAILHLKEKGSVEMRLSNTLTLLVELTFNAAVVMTILASVGVNLSSLFLPSVLALALAGKDVWQNHLAGFFLYTTQPFQPGQTLSVPCDYLSKEDPSNPLAQTRSGWFEGTCETVDLRYTVLRNGQTRLIIPNSKFVNQSFMVVDTVQCVAKVVNKKRSSTKPKEKSRRVKGTTDGAADDSGTQKRSLAENQEASSDEGD
ncbi:hypothetical protein O6H91_12G089400 [Diphasiastrum complanatum]|uniref:Uncharacterized protein n=1 Tax=Diphasiastrum complanatum TaxID=34168 RepID=A0ACC2C4N2_DIPCM|nr:hypothetical protein O6H91_12G089400 [Diphasiastrum complanatum]